MSGAPKPPKVGRWIIRVVLPEDLRDDVPCDLDEVFVRKNSERGRQRAQLWYWTEVASFSGRFLVERGRVQLRVQSGVQWEVRWGARWERGSRTWQPNCGR